MADQAEVEAEPEPEQLEPDEAPDEQQPDNVAEVEQQSDEAEAESEEQQPEQEDEIEGQEESDAPEQEPEVQLPEESHHPDPLQDQTEEMDVSENQSKESDSLPEVVEDQPEVIEDRPEVVKDQPEVVEDQPAVIESQPEVIENQPDADDGAPKVVDDHPDDAGTKSSAADAAIDSSVRIVPPPVVQMVKAPLFNAPIAMSSFPAIKPRPVGPPVPADDEYLDGPSTPAGPIPKSKGPVPLMSLKVKLWTQFCP